jgi:hypothetical protein
MAPSNQRSLWQLHWQNPRDLTQTIFVGQSGSLSSFEEFEAWFNGLIEHRRAECPQDWGPLVCDQDSHYFRRGGERFDDINDLLSQLQDARPGRSPDAATDHRELRSDSRN